MSQFSQRVHQLGLPLDQVIVVGSGLLGHLGLRQSDDVDLLAAPELFDELDASDAWEKRHDAQRHETYFVNEKVGAEVWFSLPDESGPLDHQTLLADVETHDGVKFMSLERTKNWKSWNGRDKDLADVRLLEKYLKGGADD